MAVGDDRPTLTWPVKSHSSGEPPEVVKVVSTQIGSLRAKVPQLYFYSDPGALDSGTLTSFWCKDSRTSPTNERTEKSYEQNN
jgi:hypothetical protein